MIKFSTTKPLQTFWLWEPTHPTPKLELVNGKLVPQQPKPLTPLHK